jgi:hypothetical protein
MPRCTSGMVHKKINEKDELSNLIITKYFFVNFYRPNVNWIS